MYSLILLGSLLGNTFIIIIVYKHRDLRKTVNYFIVNMAVSDFVFPLMILPVHVTGLVTDSWHWRVSGVLGSILCKFMYFISEVSVIVSAQSLVWIAIDRFAAVVFSMKLGLISAKIRTIAIACTWIVGGVFYFPKLITWGLVARGNHTLCTLVNPESVLTCQKAGDGYFWLHISLRLIGPLFIITVLYTAIAITLRRQNKAFAKVQRHSLKKNRRQALKMAVVTVVLFYICVIPHVLIYFVVLRTPCPFQRWFNVLAILLFCLSTTVNPIICLSFVGSHRRGLRNVFCGCRMGINKWAKRKKKTRKRIKNPPVGHSCRTSKHTKKYKGS